MSLSNFRRMLLGVICGALKLAYFFIQRVYTFDYDTRSSSRLRNYNDRDFW